MQSVVRALLVALVLSTSAWACPGCKLLPVDSAVTQETIQLQAKANDSFSLSVMFMLTVPMGLMVGMGFFVVKVCREVDAERGSGST
jgi:heme/copper-type cytochrome/quinol oxidase subunit 2